MDVPVHLACRYTLAMSERLRPDYLSRDTDDLAYQFDYFGAEECPQLDAWLYQALCRGISKDPELLALAAQAPPTQPAPNMLFAAVHYLLLAGEQHELREWYPALAAEEGREARPCQTVFEPFRAFCLAQRDAIVPLLETRLVQTNVLQRTSALLPAFARAFAGAGSPLALIEIGCSAGLNLQWDRFRYVYSDGTTWGDDDAGVLVECELRGEVPLPALPDAVPVAWRRGVDIHPIAVADEDAVQWLRALVWPDHPGRQERLSAAIEVARADPPQILAGDAGQALAALIADAPGSASVCVYGTHTLYQFPREALIATLRAMQEASKRRPVRFVSIEGTGDGCSELQYTVYQDGERQTTLAARCNPHGRWLEWIGGGRS